ncbi:hypothetical protein RclHR1_06690006 [Rhizophagus clarus]|uniref:Uncharacterized protein n=1 Tax=Rhizophagus clarus TaxID=94130 RepID=A0A2Z6RV98_9GLOM|nr:hypothetical protein RclHR1_06690006 [Rhizophagus clarus]
MYILILSFKVIAMSFVKVMQLQKRQTATPTKTNSNKELLAPFPTVPPILNNNTLSNNSNNQPLKNTISESANDGVSGPELLGLAGGALVVIGLIGIFISRKIAGGKKKHTDTERGYKSYPSQQLSDDYNEKEKDSPIMVDQDSSRLISSSPRTYYPPHSESNVSQLGPPSVNNNFLQNKNLVDPSSREIPHSSPYLPQTPNSNQKDLSHSPDSYRGPSLDDDSSNLLQSPFTPNFKQKDSSYPSDSYKRSSRDGYPSSPSQFTLNTPNTPNTPKTPSYPPNTYGGSSLDDYPSPFLPPSPFTPNTPNTPNTPSYPPNTYRRPSPDDYPSQSPFVPNSQQGEQLQQPKSYGGPQNDQFSPRFQQHNIDPIQGTLLSPKSSDQPQQYKSPPHSRYSLEDPPHCQLFSKSEPVTTNDQNSSSESSIVNNTNSDNMNESLSINSDIINNELKELDDMFANIMSGDNSSSLSEDYSQVSDNSFTRLLSDIPTNEKSNQPDSQTSSIYSVQPTQVKSQIEMASENKIPKTPSSNLSQDQNLPQMMQPAAISYIKPMQSNMVIESINESSDTSEVQLNMTQPITTQFIQPSQSNMVIESVNESSDTSEVQLNMTQPITTRFIQPSQSNTVIESVNESSDTSEVQLNMTQPITTRFIQPSQSNMKIEKVDTIHPEMSAPIVAGVGPKPLYDIDGIKKHAKMILSKKTEKVTENNETQNSENIIKENDDNQGKPLVRKKSVRFQAESDQEDAVKVSKSKKSILINKNDVINVQSTAQQSSTLESEYGDVKSNHRDSKSNSYQMYDFDISGYQDDSS